MKHVKVGLLNRKRGNFTIQEKFTGAGEVTDQTLDEVRHHDEALRRGGYDVRVGSEVAFDVNYSALLRAMASPYVTKRYRGASPVPSEISVPVSAPEALAQIREVQIDSCP